MPEQETIPTPQQGRSTPSPGTPAIVDVFARTKPDGTLDFSHDWRWQDGSAGGKGSIDVPKREQGDPGTPIHFHLKDETWPARGLSFTDDPAGAMWVRRDSCPPENQRSEDPELPPGKMHRSPKLLKVFDENNEECTLHYRLRFKDQSGKAESYDPDITNGGTTRM